jgi:hypothetical protein
MIRVTLDVGDQSVIDVLIRPVLSSTTGINRWMFLINERSYLGEFKDSRSGIIEALGNPWYLDILHKVLDDSKRGKAISIQTEYEKLLLAILEAEIIG